MKPAISIVIRCKNEERFIGQTLKMVFCQEIGLPFEVIVIDSGSTDRTLDIVRGFDVRLYEIQPGRFTYGSALNYGAGLARGEYIVNLSAHCIPVDKSWMAALLEPLLKDSSIAASFGRQEPIKGLNPFEEIALISDFSLDENGRVGLVFSNSNCMIKKVVWEKYPFDEKASFAEDFIWAKLHLPPEFKIKYINSASVYHSHPLSIKYWSNRYYVNGLVEMYVDICYGIKWPWSARVDKKRNRLLHLLKKTKSFMHELKVNSSFLKENKYYLHILILPFFLLLRGYYYRKGLEEGKTKYAAEPVK